MGGEWKGRNAIGMVGMGGMGDGCKRGVVCGIWKEGLSRIILP